MEANQQQYLHVYKNKRIINNPGEQLPIQTSERISTDVICTIVTTLFAVTMFILALVWIDVGKLQKITYPTDQQGRYCTLDNNQYNYLYFTSYSDPSKRLCLNSCPKGNQTVLNCWPTNQLSCHQNSNPQFQVNIYPSYASETSLGLFCQPSNNQLREQILSNANLLDTFNFVTAYKSIGISFLAAIAIGIIGVLLYSCIPLAMTYTSIILGGIVSLLFGSYLFISNLHEDIIAGYKVIIFILSIMLLFIGLFLLWGIIWKRKEVNTSIFYLREASKLFWEMPQLILLSLVFLIFLIVLTALCGFQVLACWSKSDIIFEKDSTYYRLNGSFAIFMTILNIVEFMWGLCFLKEAFNFILSGTTAKWYYQQDKSLMFSIGNLLKFHWGSVAAGALLLNLLYPFDMVYDIIKPSQNNNGLYRKLCCCCERIFDLTKSEAMTMINLVGMPYCNASRWCQKIQFHSEQVDGSQSANRFVRIGSHMFLAFLSTLVGFIYMKSNGTVSLIALLIIFIITIFALTFFICLLKDIAESIFFCQMVNQYYEEVIQNMPKDKSQIKKQLFQEGYEVLATNH